VFGEVIEDRTELVVGLELVTYVVLCVEVVLMLWLNNDVLIYTDVDISVEEDDKVFEVESLVEKFFSVVGVGVDFVVFAKLSVVFEIF